MEGTVEEKDCIGKVSDVDYLVVTTLTYLY